jgi:1,4-alpha-glucan branching enzyme
MYICIKKKLFFTQSFENYKIGTNYPSDHIIVLDTDEVKRKFIIIYENKIKSLKKRFGGQERLRPGHEKPFPFRNEPYCNRNFSLSLYIPSRTGIVLRPVDHGKK